MVKKLLSWILPLTTITVVIAASALVLYPWSRDALEKRDQIPQKQERLGRLVSKLKTLNSVNQEQISQYLLDIEVVLPSEPQPPLALASLEALASNAGLAVGSAQYTGEKDSTVSAEISARGEYAQLIDFLSKLQGSSPVLKVQSFKLSKRESNHQEDAAAAENQTSAVLQAEAPFKEIVKDLGEIESQVKTLSAGEKEVLEKAQALETLLVPIDDASIETVEKGKENPFE